MTSNFSFVIMHVLCQRMWLHLHHLNNLNLQIKCSFSIWLIEFCGLSSISECDRVCTHQLLLQTQHCWWHCWQQLYFCSSAPQNQPPYFVGNVWKAQRMSSYWLITERSQGQAKSYCCYDCLSLWQKILCLYWHKSFFFKKFVLFSAFWSVKKVTPQQIQVWLIATERKHCFIFIPTANHKNEMSVLTFVGCALCCCVHLAEVDWTSQGLYACWAPAG